MRILVGLLTNSFANLSQEGISYSHTDDGLSVLAARRYDLVFPRDLIWPGRQSRSAVAGLTFPLLRREARSGEGASFVKRRGLVPSYRRPLARFGATWLPTVSSYFVLQTVVVLFSTRPKDR